jgi:RinA family phage transcriptional activator
MLDRATFKYIEKEIYAFEKTKKRIEEIRTEIILSTSYPQEIRTPDPKDPTGIITTRLMLDIRLQRLQFITDAIEESITIMLPEVLDVLSYKYWKYPKIQWAEVAHRFRFDEKTVYNWRREFIEDIAKELGGIDV